MEQVYAFIKMKVMKGDIKLHTVIVFYVSYDFESFKCIRATLYLIMFSFRYVFWTEFGNTAQIVRANMDGTSKSFIAKKQIGWPNGLTLDFKSKVCTHFHLKFTSLMFFFVSNLNHFLYSKPIVLDGWVL